MLAALTGVDYTLDEFMRIGARIWNQERLWNLEVGYTRADDTLPARLLTEPIKTGPSKGEINHLDQMLPEYYGLRGWDENGVPTEAKLAELAL
jgi:aldehyde:ferredoxin oxidoreductase